MSGRSWRLARSLIKMREQINEAFPSRSRRIDGDIGDFAHSQRVSDHNPDRHGVVRAIDITHDPARGCDTYQLAERLRVGRDRRLKYVISERRIFSATNTPWVWRPYSLTPHNGHIHISCVADLHVGDQTHAWALDFDGRAYAADEGLRGTLRLGSSGKDVKTLQRLLGGVVVDGIFGTRTDAVVRAFQRSVGIAVDGVVGPVTYEHLDFLEVSEPE